jgi:pimeloyl-ACP methyl ester carboxylesterase
VQKKIISSDSIPINYSITRKSDLFLIFIHGLGGDLKIWSREREFFSKKGYSTLTIDLRGHGLSGRPCFINQYALKRFAQDINEVVEHEKIKRCIFIGHCFGGSVLITFHALFPLCGESYVLIDTTYKATKPMKIFNQDYLSAKILNFILKPIGVRKKNLYHVDFRKHIGTGDWNIRRIYNDIRSVGLKSYMFTLENFAGFEGTKYLKKFNKPVLIIEGERDSVFSMKVASEMHVLIKGSRLKIIPGANHQVTLNNIGELEELIYVHLKKII